MTIKRAPGADEIWDMREYDPMTDHAIGLDWLHQDKEWITRDGRRLTLEEMAPEHRANLLAYLRRRAPNLEFLDTLAMLSSPLGAPRGQHAQDDVERLLDEQHLDPGAWLESTRLVTRLRELVEADRRAAIGKWTGAASEEMY
jgi:hypothetical protein